MSKCSKAARESQATRDPGRGGKVHEVVQAGA